ncbi:MAG TPA: acetyl-CoA carboxylase biotin carboxyl carrier protein [Terriglobales bacterium]|nr:acetyl-CoA carboxylase biotin carboxyl carrier protein [Terriglobales bacterium]
MNSKEIKELVEFLIEKDVTEFELERGDVKMRIKRGQQVQVVQAPVAPMMTTPVVPAAIPMAAPSTMVPSAPVATPGPSAPQAPAEEEGLHHVKSPIVGTFYESPSPGAPPFIKPGDHVAAGQVLCIVEAMKLMNEIESDIAGEVVKALVANGQPVEYGQPLFAIRPK